MSRIIEALINGRLVQQLGLVIWYVKLAILLSNDLDEQKRLREYHFLAEVHVSW
jgi:hypothetical protein